MISAEDRERISASIHDAEAKTSGEIVCVLAKSSVRSTALPVVVAATAALLLPWLLVTFTAMPVFRILSFQVVTFLSLVAIFCWPPIRVALTPRSARRAAAYRAATEQFKIRGLTRKKERTGILIFVSLAERYARVIADEGISARVPQSQWQVAIDELIKHMREGRIGDGFVAAVDVCGKELSKNFPPTGTSGDDLPDRIFLI